MLSTGGGSISKTFSHLSFSERRARSDLYSKIISLDNLFQAWEEFKRGKRKKKDVAEFERNLEDNLFSLHEELISKTYQHSSYTGFYVHDPKIRHIHKAIVKDRVVHHAVFRILNPLFEPTFISDSYSCRVGKGTHRGFKQLVNFSRKVSKNYTQPCWALKMDIKKFFDSVDHQILLGLVKRKIKDEDLVWLLEEIVDSYHTQTGKGIPIGNLTSQLFANVYLNELDQFVKHKLKVKYYIRYADDFLILKGKEEDLNQYISLLISFLKNSLRLELHPRKVFLRKLNWGIDFLGYIALPHYQLIRTKTKRRLFRKIRERARAVRNGSVAEESFKQTLASYFGVLQHSNSHEMGRDLKNQVWYWLTE